MPTAPLLLSALLIIPAQDWGSHPKDMSHTRHQTPAFITIHHAGEFWTPQDDPVKFLCTLQKWGQSPPSPPRKAVWPDVPYHFLIAPDGRIFQGRPIEYAGETNTRFDVLNNIGVEMMGDFERQRPGPEQLRSMVRLVAALAQKYRIPMENIRGHMEALEPAAKNDPICQQDPTKTECVTDCPGRDVDRYIKDGELAQWLEQAREGKEPDVKEGPPLPQGPVEPIPVKTADGVTPWTRCP